MEDHRSEFPLEKMCKALGVSRSGYYTWRSRKPSERVRRKVRLLKRITYHFNDSQQRYGAPKIAHLLRQEGETVTERTVGLYMQELGFRACVSRTFKVQTTDSNHDLPIAPNLLNQQFHVEKPNKVWVADITYIPCREGRLYLASVLDLCTREIVGWRLSDRMNTDLVLGALKDAHLAKRPKKGLIHHSDRGSQYASEDYRKQLKTYRMITSMSRKGNCYDNACMESFHSILKKELIYCKRFRTKQQAYDEIYRYIEFFYNRKRIHGALGYLSPIRFAARFNKRKAS
ncbi:IS3 family transposase [Paenibacillus sabinae]|uniref:Integrase catalytic subunit n=1 Tax=Paenibacillus sabinae T27 TaxID=1268072 RepID=X4ZXJ5_9BACL|nr:IS3 family transposase [Paenibacillus sabinae]AHV95354.1 integrase catalytic subunit [Paenibacillus sabinae T27]AHV96409.1 integrase catalytic subunit [Paenibacillus sabinae T27]AHV96453.1 integrase catalytic subunit [Paenibacillus sabinae T27]AHV97692.1 integrase catalytic subunit [Paenibacillus sabinae T27]AHV98731.1 integrase catalytic subunit [Paenibacillus sabinae T27]